MMFCLSEVFYVYVGMILLKYFLVVVFEGGYSVGFEKGLFVFMVGYLSGECFEVLVCLLFEILSIMEWVKEILGEWWEF